MVATLLAYTIAAALLTVTPGADTLLVVRHAAGGPRAGYLAAIGVCAGTLVWGAIVAAGVAALIVANPLLYDLLRWAGAAYLIWLGLTLLFAQRGNEPANTPARADNPFASGLLTNLLNPKVGVFYLAFLPQFVPAGMPHAPFILLLAAIHALLGMIWFAVLIAGVGRAASRLRHSTASALLARLTGILFVGFGARLLLSNR